MASLLGYFFGGNKKTEEKETDKQQVDAVPIVEDWVVVTEQEINANASAKSPQNDVAEKQDMEDNFETVEGSVASLVEFSPTIMDDSMKKRFQLFLQEQQSQRLHGQQVTPALLESHLISISIRNSALETVAPQTNVDVNETNSDTTQHQAPIVALNNVHLFGEDAAKQIPQAFQYTLSKITVQKLEKQKSKNMIHSKRQTIKAINKSNFQTSATGHARLSKQHSHRNQHAIKSRGKNF